MSNSDQSDLSDQEYVVEKILKRRERKGKVKYRQSTNVFNVLNFRGVIILILLSIG